MGNTLYRILHNQANPRMLAVNEMKKTIHSLSALDTLPLFCFKIRNKKSMNLPYVLKIYFQIFKI